MPALPIEWRCDVDQEAATIRDLLDDHALGELIAKSSEGQLMIHWGRAVAANILNAGSDRQRVMRAWAWIETLESFR